MRSILAVMKKELKSIFTNKAILAQIILIPFVYVFGFTMMMTMMAPTEDTQDVDKISGYFINIDGEGAEVLGELGLKSGNVEQLDLMKAKIESGDIDVVVMFPDNFVESLGASVQDVQIWYDSSVQDSYMGFVAVSEVLNSLNPKLFTINANTDNTYDLINENEALQEMLAMVFPMYVLIAVIMASQALAAESIAGDKERGFLNMILLAPVKRYTIAVGKSLSLIIVNAVSTITAFIAVAISLPKFSETLSEGATLSYAFADYINFFLMTISATTLLLSFILLISAVASGVKQASQSSGFVMIIVMLCTIFMSSGMDVVDEILNAGTINAYIPVWNAIIGMQGVFKQTMSPDMMFITLIVNTTVTIFVLGVIAKMFASEKIVNNATN